MEFFGAFDQEWESLNNMFSFEDSDFIFASAADHNNYNYHYNYNVNNNNNINNINNLIFPSDHPIENIPHFYPASQESSNSSEFETAGLVAIRAVEDNSFRAADYGGVFSHEDTFEPMDFILPAVFSDEIRQLKAETWCEVSGNAGEGGDSSLGMQLKRKFVETSEIRAPDNLPQPPKKMTPVSKEANKTKRNPRSKKSKTSNGQTTSFNEQANNNVVGNGQSSSTCSSEEGDSNELKNGGSKGKSKAGKGQATDPQSIYARKRRERINERLKILQTLVPNGTKIDISTMLEEAVDYVKFLQLQIKVLSSDDMWMYAPIAYNGMDMGLYQKIVQNL